MELATTEATSTLRLNQKVKRGKLAALQRHLNVTGNLDLIDLKLKIRLKLTGRCKLTTDAKKGATILEFQNSDRWVPLAKQTGEFFRPKALGDELVE